MSCRIGLADKNRIVFRKINQLSHLEVKFKSQKGWKGAFEPEATVLGMQPKSEMLQTNPSSILEFRIMLSIHYSEFANSILIWK